MCLSLAKPGGKTHSILIQKQKSKPKTRRERKHLQNARISLEEAVKASFDKENFFYQSDHEVEQPYVPSDNEIEKEYDMEQYPTYQRIIPENFHFDASTHHITDISVDSVENCVFKNSLTKTCSLIEIDEDSPHHDKKVQKLAKLKNS